MTPDLDALRIDHPETAVAPPRTSRGWMVAFFLLLIASSTIIALLWFGSDRAGGEITVKVERIRVAGSTAGDRTSRSGPFSAAGWVKLPLRFPVLVTPLIEGRIERIDVIEGDQVKAGQVIARLYDKDLRAAFAAAEAQVQEAAANLDKLKTGYRPQEVAEARAEVERLDAELENASEVLAHSRKLQPSGAIPLEELQRDESLVRVLTAKRAKAKERLALMVEGFRREDIAIAAAVLARASAERDIARLRLGYTDIKSPIDGVVIERSAVVGQWIVPKTGTVVALFDPAQLEARVDVNQDDIARVFVGQDVDLSTRAEPGKRHRGKVNLIEPRADQIKNTVPVRVSIAVTQGRPLHPDMVVSTRFLPKGSGAGGSGGADGKDAAPKITVPVIAVCRDDAGPHVFAMMPGRTCSWSSAAWLSGGRSASASWTTGATRSSADCAAGIGSWLPASRA
ncbi:MAG: HlyD family secretion protein [Planctomycetota bacterium]